MHRERDSVRDPLPTLVVIALLNLLVERLLDVRQTSLLLHRLPIRRKLLASPGQLDAHFSFRVVIITFHRDPRLLHNQPHLHSLLPNRQIILTIAITTILFIVVFLLPLLFLTTFLLLLLHLHLLFPLGFLDLLDVFGRVGRLAGHSLLD